MVTCSIQHSDATVILYAEGEAELPQVVLCFAYGNPLQHHFFEAMKINILCLLILLAEFAEFAEFVHLCKMENKKLL